MYDRSEIMSEIYSWEKELDRLYSLEDEDLEDEDKEEIRDVEERIKLLKDILENEKCE